MVVIDDRHRNGYDQVRSVCFATIVLQCVNDRPNRRNLSRLVDVLPEFGVVGGEVRVSVDAAGEVQVAGLFGWRRGAGVGGGEFLGGGRENGFDLAGRWIEDGGGFLADDLAELAAFVDA